MMLLAKQIFPMFCILGGAETSNALYMESHLDLNSFKYFLFSHSMIACAVVRYHNHVVYVTLTGLYYHQLR